MPSRLERNIGTRECPKWAIYRSALPGASEELPDFPHGNEPHFFSIVCSSDSTATGVVRSPQSNSYIIRGEKRYVEYKNYEIIDVVKVLKETDQPFEFDIIPKPNAKPMSFRTFHIDD